MSYFEDSIPSVDEDMISKLHNNIQNIQEDFLQPYFQRLNIISESQNQILRRLINTSDFFSNSPEVAEIKKMDNVLQIYKEKNLKLIKSMDVVGQKCLQLQSRINKVRRKCKNGQAFREQGIFFYKCVKQGGIRILKGPSVNANSIGQTLKLGQTFQAFERLFVTGDNHTYVHIVGSGWVYENIKDSICLQRLPNLQRMEQVLQKQLHQTEVNDLGESIIEELQEVYVVEEEQGEEEYHSNILPIGSRDHSQNSGCCNSSDMLIELDNMSPTETATSVPIAAAAETGMRVPSVTPQDLTTNGNDIKNVVYDNHWGDNSHIVASTHCNNKWHCDRNGDEVTGVGGNAESGIQKYVTENIVNNIRTGTDLEDNFLLQRVEQIEIRYSVKDNDQQEINSTSSIISNFVDRNEEYIDKIEADSSTVYCRRDIDEDEEGIFQI